MDQESASAGGDIRVHRHRIGDGDHGPAGACGSLELCTRRSGAAGVVVLGGGDCHLGLAEPMLNRLRVLRAERGWSQAEVAKLAQVSRQTINAIETGKYDPSLPLAFMLARIFERTIEEIFSPEG